MSIKFSDLPITQPAFHWQVSNNPSMDEMKVHEWIQPYREEVRGLWDAVILGVPLSRSSISASGASEFPNAFRKTWPKFTTYNLDLRLDLGKLNVCDLGDVKMHVTDIARCHNNISSAMAGIQQLYPNSLTISIGGDHSITAMLVKGIHQVYRDKKIGILQLDTHLDLRDLTDNGPSNGTPIRNLIEQRIIEGKHVYNIGPHGFFNTKALVKFADEHEVNIITLKEVRKKGIETVIAEALRKLTEEVDVIYVTCDMDVLDIAVAPGVPVSTPGGLTTFELFEALTIAGMNEKVKAMDIVCLDPLRDYRQQPTVKAGTHAFLSFLSGYALKKRR
ncbi:agmatinase family protein [Bacillus kwashiorkori]|uniref:agmatinase family protein n=1 Tax=Bacillus kwashiorkori TaxID=1522318 RepID=UPI0007848540|nr:agmatinase family protein [Bacillus kwashiorkori]